jgi:hypothetical protein
MTPSVRSDASASNPGIASGTWSKPSGSVTSAAIAWVPATVATGSTPARLRFRYHAPTA